MAVYDSGKKLILTQIIKAMILLFCLFLLYILFASTSSPIKDIKSVRIKASQLEDLTLDLFLVKGIPIAAVKINNKWQFLNAVNKLSGCVVKVQDNSQWYDVCSKQSYQLNGKAKGNYADLITIKSKPTDIGFRLYLNN